MENADGQALSAGCSGVMGGAVPKAGDEGVGVKTGGASPGGAAAEGRLATAEKMAAAQDAAGRASVVPGLPVGLQGQRQDNRLVSCARSAPSGPRTCPRMDETAACFWGPYSSVRFPWHQGAGEMAEGGVYLDNCQLPLVSQHFQA